MEIRRLLPVGDGAAPMRRGGLEEDGFHQEVMRAFIMIRITDLPLARILIGMIRMAAVGGYFPMEGVCQNDR